MMYKYYKRMMYKYYILYNYNRSNNIIAAENLYIIF